MSKRRINKQQANRIKKIQQRYLASDESANAPGLILSRFKQHAEVEDEDGKRILCEIRPHLDSLVAGDRVIWQAEGEQQGVVVSRCPRQSILGRPDKQGEIRPIAANITQILVVVAPKPVLSWPLLDSYLVMAESLQLKINIILNKIDLPCAALQEELIRYYNPLGYQLFFISQKHQHSYNNLRKNLNEHSSVVVGQSGVGKSSIIANLLPNEQAIQVAEISALSEFGCHTTRNSRFYHLPHGGALIDSPGVREFGLWHMPVNEIANNYREFKPLLSHCKFRNCDHYQAPGCAIVQALHDEQISAKRYANFRKLCLQFSKP